MVSRSALLFPKNYVANLHVRSSPEVKVLFLARNELISSMKQVVSSKNTLVSSNKHVGLQCDIYLVVNSRDYLVASDKCICLHNGNSSHIVFVDWSL